MTGSRFRSDWTDERRETARRLFERGVSASQIAEALGGGVSRNAVIGMLARMGARRTASAVAATLQQAPKHRPRLPTHGGGAATKTVGKVRHEIARVAPALIAAPGAPAPPPEAPHASASPWLPLLALPPHACTYPGRDAPAGAPGRSLFGGLALEDGAAVYCPHHARLCRSSASPETAGRLARVAGVDGDIVVRRRAA